MRTLSRRKISDELPFPVILDMAEYCQRPGVMGSECGGAASGSDVPRGSGMGPIAEGTDAAGTVSTAGESTKYALFAVMMHLGGTHGGHYFAYIRDQGADGADGGERVWVPVNGGAPAPHEAGTSHNAAESAIAAAVQPHPLPADGVDGECSFKSPFVDGSSLPVGAESIAIPAAGCTAADASVMEGKRGRWIKFNDASVDWLPADRLQWAFGWKEAAKKASEAEAIAAAGRIIEEPSVEQELAAAKAGLESKKRLDTKSADGTDASGDKKGAKSSGKPDLKRPESRTGVSVSRSTSNAYMLVYRRIDVISAAEQGTVVAQRAQLPPVVAASDIPGDIAAEVAADNADWVKLKKEWDYQCEMVHVRVYGPADLAPRPGGEQGDPAKAALIGEQRRAGGTKEDPASSSRHGKQVSFSLHESTTVGDLVCEAARRVGLLQDGKSVTQKTYKASGKKSESKPSTDGSLGNLDSNGNMFANAVECKLRCRLRHYDLMNGIMLAPIEWAATKERATRESTQTGDELSQAPISLNELDPALGPHRPLLIEVKASPESPWTPWRPGGLPLRLAPLKLGTHQFARPHQIVIDDDSAVTLRRAAATYMKLPPRLVRLFVLTDSGPSEIGEDETPGPLKEPHASLVDAEVAAEALAERLGSLHAAEEMSGLGGSAESGADASVGATDVRSTVLRQMQELLQHNSHRDETRISLSRSLRLVAGNTVFAEQRAVDPSVDPEHATAESSRAKSMLDGLVNSVTIECIVKGFGYSEGVSTEKGLPGVQLIQVELDQRRPLDELRESIAEQLKCHTGDFKIMREGTHGPFLTKAERVDLQERRKSAEAALAQQQAEAVDARQASTHSTSLPPIIAGSLRVGPELKNGSKSLEYYGMMGGGRVLIRRGRPLSMGEYSFKVAIYDDKHAASIEDSASDKPSASARVQSSAKRTPRPRPKPQTGSSARPRPALVRPGPRPTGGNRPSRPGPRPAPRPRPGLPVIGSLARSPMHGVTVSNVKTGASEAFVMACRVELSGDTPVKDAKQIICQALHNAAKQQVIAGSDIDKRTSALMGMSGPLKIPVFTHCRIRLGQGSKLGPALADSGTLSSGSKVKMRDGMVLIIQRTAVAESLQADDTLLILRRWFSAEARLGPPHEVCVRGKATYRDLAIVAQRVSRIETGLEEDASPEEDAAQAATPVMLHADVSPADCHCHRTPGIAVPQSLAPVSGFCRDSASAPASVDSAVSTFMESTPVPSASPQSTESSALESTQWVPAKRVRFATAFQWQLRTPQDVAELRRWAQQPMRSSSLAGAPWNIKSGDIVVFRDAADGDLLSQRSHDPTEGLRPWAGTHASRGPGGPREQAFHILTSAERHARAEQREREDQEEQAEQAAAAKTMRSVKERMSGGAAEGSDAARNTSEMVSDGAALVDGHDLSRFIRMLSVGVREREVGIAMAAEGLDIALLHTAVRRMKADEGTGALPASAIAEQQDV